MAATHFGGLLTQIGVAEFFCVANHPRMSFEQPLSFLRKTNFQLKNWLAAGALVLIASGCANKHTVTHVMPAATKIISASQPAKISVAVDQPGHKVSPTLWGIFFEDINLSADGGLYPELVRNRSFEDSDKPDFWKLSNVAGGNSSAAIDD